MSGFDIARFSSVVLCLFFISNVNHVIAQDYLVKVEVRDKQSRKAIEFANILIMPCSCGGVSDAAGTLVATLPADRYTIVSSFIGYEADTTVVKVNAHMTVEVLLKEDGVLLNSVVVRGRDTRENIENTLMGVQQLSIDKIKILPSAVGEVDILKSLTMLSGVSSAGEASNGLSVRGGSLDQNLVLFEEAPVYNTTHLFGLFSVFTPEAVRGVELYQANMPAKFGGRISSIVDVKVHNPDLDEVKLSGGVGLVSSRLALETPIVKHKLSLLIAGRISFNDFLLRQINRLKNTQANFIDGTSKLRYQVNEKNSLSLTTFYSRDIYQLDINSKIRDITSEANVYDYSTFNNTLTWTSDLGNKTFVKTSLIRSLFNPNILFPQLDSEDEIAFESGIRNTGLKSEFSAIPNDELKYSFGIQAEQTLLRPGKLTSLESAGIREEDLPDESGLELAGFASIDWSPIKALSISMGLRYGCFILLGPYIQALYDDSNLATIVGTQDFEAGTIAKSYHYPEPRFGLRYKIIENISIKASYALTRQYLQNIYNSTTPLPTSRWKLSDAYILPQTGSTYSLGYYQNFLQNTITFGVEGYYRFIDNVLDYKPGADFFLEEFIEKDVLQGRGENYGLEFSLEKSKGRINGWWNYTWSRSLRIFEASIPRDRINNNQWFPSDFDRPHVFNGSVNIEANAFNTFSFNFTYQTGRPYTIPSATIRTQNLPIPIFLQRNNSRLPDYHRLDFSWRVHNITTKETRWKGDWIFTIYNLYNRNNAFNIFYAGRSQGRNAQRLGVGPLASYQLSIFSSTVVSLGYNFTFK